MKPFGILAWPAYATKEGNPYNYLIYHNIEKKGYPVYEFSFSAGDIIKAVIATKYRILHIHWPTHIISYSGHFYAWCRMQLFFLFIRLIKLSGRKIVWTVHNLEAHESNNHLLQKRMYNFLYQHTDGFISLNQAGLTRIREKTGKASGQKFAYIGHPHYKGYYKNTVDKAEARKILSIPENKFVFAFIGQIRAYKNVTALVRTFKNLKADDKYLLIAGGAHPEIAGELTSEVQDVECISLHKTFLKDDDLQIYLNAADLVVTPYSKIFNSGSVFLNISFDKPTLAPATGAFPELQKSFGGHLIKLFSGELTEAALEKAMTEVKREGEFQATGISAFSPENIAEETIRFYKAVLQS